MKPRRRTRSRKNRDGWLPPGPGETVDGDLDLVMQALLLPVRAWRAAGIALLGVAVMAGGIVALSLFPDVDLVGLVIVPMAMALGAIPWAITVAVRWWRRYRAVRRTGWHRASAVRRTHCESCLRFAPLPRASEVTDYGDDAGCSLHLSDSG